MAGKQQHIITITPPIDMTVTPPSPKKLYITAPPRIHTVASNNVIDIEQQQQQQQANTSNVPGYGRSCARFYNTVPILLGLLIISLSVQALLIRLAKQNSGDSSAFISHLENSVGFGIYLIGWITTNASGFLLLAFVSLLNIDLKYSLQFKFWLVVFLFGIVFCPSLLLLQIFATHLAYRVCGGVILAAYLGGLSYYIGRW